MNGALKDELLDEIDGLVDAYWGIAFNEGRDGRTTDTPAGDAQRVRSALTDRLAKLATLPRQEAEAGPVAFIPQADLDRLARTGLSNCRIYRERTGSRFVVPLYASPSVPEAKVVSGVTVKALKWPDTPRRGQRVRSGGGLLGYTIAYYGGDDPAMPAVYRWAADDSSWSSALLTYDDAKAAAQSDYEQRIRSALSSKGES